jgi:hypothetical protein
MKMKDDVRVADSDITLDEIAEVIDEAMDRALAPLLQRLARLEGKEVNVEDFSAAIAAALAAP